VIERDEDATKRILAAGKVISSSVSDGAGAKKAADAGHRLIACTNSGLLVGASRSYLAQAREG
jgi:hypothetical protein